MRKTWVVRPVSEEMVGTLSDALKISPVLAHLLVGRGIKSAVQAADFLFSDLGLLADPERMAGLADAIHLLKETIQTRRKIFILGDYDSDGITSAALLTWALRDLGADFSVYIPHRLQEGYGLRTEMVRKAAADGASLLITVDCGTTHFEELALARALGMRTIVMDHHDLVPGRPPEADAFLNPLRPDCEYPENELASVGVVFTMLRGLMGSLGRLETLWQHLDLVALGTIADMAPLTGENRLLVRAGLHALTGTKKPGLRCLIEKQLEENRPLTPEDVSFRLAPPLNAMGRLASAEVSYRLLTTTDPEEAGRLVKEILRENRNRIELNRQVFTEALEKVSREINFARERVLVLDDPGWHPGVIGIVATRLSKRFHRPVVMIASGGEGHCRGSARSIEPFPLVDALRTLQHHLVEFGGHPGAAGLTIAKEKIGPFRQALNELALEQYDPAAWTPTVKADWECSLHQLDELLMREMELLAPFGIGNPRPVFVTRDARLAGDHRPKGFHRMGMKLAVQTVSAQPQLFEAIHPREMVSDGLRLSRVNGPVHLAYSPVARWDAEKMIVELHLQDLRIP